MSVRRCRVTPPRPFVPKQHRMRDLAREAAPDGVALNAAYDRLYRCWFACGIPAFIAVLAIVWLMAARPQLGFR